jgi:hypothetical protein
MFSSCSACPFDDEEEEEVKLSQHLPRGLAGGIGNFVSKIPYPLPSTALVTQVVWLSTIKTSHLNFFAGVDELLAAHTWRSGQMQYLRFNGLSLSSLASTGVTACR